MRLRTTALPIRREVIKPARQGPDCSTGRTFSASTLPPRTNPSCFTRSYSDACVRRRPFGKGNEPTGCISRDCTAEVFPQRFSGEDFAKRHAAELTNRAVSELAIPLLQRETQL